MKKTLLFYFLFLFVNTICFAQSNQTESLTITTYYPAPYGVYRNLRLNPSEEPQGSAVQPGVMYFNKSREEILIYKNATAKWVPLGGAASSGDALVNAAHTQSDCTNHVPRGEVVPTGTGLSQCRFDLPACPVGWTRYGAYSALGSATCNACAQSCCGNSCTVGPRAWMDLPGSLSCTCTQSVHCTRAPWGSGCDSCGGYCSTVPCCGYDRACRSDDTRVTVTTPIIQIGCY